MFPLVCHLPGEEGREVWGRLAALGDTGVEERTQPMAGIETPHEERLEHTKHHRGKVRTPDAAGAIIVLAADDRGPQGPCGTVIVQRHFGTRQEDGEPTPVVVEALEDGALRPFASRQAICPIIMALGRESTLHIIPIVYK